ncbi:MAG: hypothetical protein V1790_14440 [Planctomycetota bacterium]
MATKTLTRSDEAVARAKPEIAKSGYTNGWWAVRRNQVELHFDCEENIEAGAVEITEAAFKADINREIAKIAALPPFAHLRNLRSRIANAELTINTAREKSEELKSGLGPDASPADVARVRKGLDDCESRVAEAMLQRDNARRFTADAFAECQRVAGESRAALEEGFRDRAANFVTRLGDEFWAVAKEFFVQMSVAENQTVLANSYIQQIMTDVDLILNPAGLEAELFRRSCIM